jgi:hypothetical protein
MVEVGRVVVVVRAKESNQSNRIADERDPFRQD